MTYKQNLFFIAQCLTVKFEKKNKKEVLIKLKNENIDWDEITKISTNHLVFSALYCNLKKVKFLKYLPKELIIYMKYGIEIRCLTTNYNDLNWKFYYY